MIIHIPLPWKRFNRTWERERVYIRISFYHSRSIRLGGYRSDGSVFRYFSGYSFALDTALVTGKVRYPTIFDID